MIEPPPNDLTFRQFCQRSAGLIRQHPARAARLLCLLAVAVLCGLVLAAEVVWLVAASAASQRG